jgi:uronate dehydrogenase
MASADMDRILITGAAGDVGTRLTALFKSVYREVRLSDRVAPKSLDPKTPFVRADLAKMDEVAAAVDGIEGIVHLGGQSVEAPWETILSANIVGAYNLFEAARRAGVKRIVFATSNHAMGFYPRDAKIGTNASVRPDTRYGLSKAFGEALGALYAFKHGLRVFNIRIGNVGDKPLDGRRLGIWLKTEDLAQLVRIGLEHPDVHYEIVYGMSNNAAAWWDNSNAFRLGYRPTGVAEDFRAEAMAAQAKLAPNPIADLLQGGPFCADEFTGDFDDLLSRLGRGGKGKAS